MSDRRTLQRITSSFIVSATCVLALLYYGRGVLQPLALAAILSLVIAPLIRSFSRAGLKALPATLLSVLLVGSCMVAVSVILATQLVSVTRDLPQYRAAIKSKVEKVREITEKPFARLEAELTALTPPTADGKSRTGLSAAAARTQPIPVEIRQPGLSTRQAVAWMFAVAWGPLGEAGLVLVLLVFILLEHESLRDRVVQLAGQTEVSRTLKTLGDAAQGVSRFFFSQFIVNLTFGTVVAVVLWGLGVPHAALWGALSGMLRFVPYLGVMAAGGFIALFVAAIDPGWTLPLVCMAVFVALELAVANIIEPKVYGHSSGLSPLGVIVSAIFWGALWGPVGLLLSTPLTLCLVVAGRHLPALEPITILFGDAPSVSGSQRFYQRVLAADLDSIIHDARQFLRKCSFARYCDQILLPGLALAEAERRSGRIEEIQQARLRGAIVALAETLAPVCDSGPRHRRRQVSLLDANVGAHLRKMREERLGRWQGSLDVPAHSVVLCAGLANERDDVLGELLVRSLRAARIDARSLSMGGGDQETPDGKEDLVSTVFLVYPVEEHYEQWLGHVRDLRANLPHALLVTVRLPFDENAVKLSSVEKQMDMILRSYEEGLAFVTPERSARGQLLPEQISRAA